MCLEKGLSTDDNWQYSNTFSSGSLVGSMKRNELKAHESEGKVADADITTALSRLPILHRLVQRYGRQNVFNADESALCFRLPPKAMIGTALQGRKGHKNRVKLLFCCNAPGSEVFSRLWSVGQLANVGFGCNCLLARIWLRGTIPSLDEPRTFLLLAVGF